MADQDDSEKTEDPTAKRIADARRKGNVARSQEINSWAALVGLLIVLVTLLPWLMPKIVSINYKYFEKPHLLEVTRASMQSMVGSVGYELLFILGPIFAFFMFLGFLSTYIQVGRTFSWEKIQPKLSKISLIAGIKRMFSSRSLVEFAKGITKLVLVSLVLIFTAIPFLSDLELFPGFALSTSFERIQDVAIVLIFWTVAIMTIVATLDFVYQKHDHFKKLKMTKQEVKDEHRQMEGDPKVKARLAQIRQDRQRARMMANVAKADVVITNPTHYAVALEYDMENMPAPVLVAKGLDELAMRIREEADLHEVPIVENPPLARALYASVELDESIPEHLYHAVAEVIGYVYKLNGRMPNDGPIVPPPVDWSLDERPGEAET